MPTIVAFHPSGFEVRFEVELSEIKNMVRKLEKSHYRPSREMVYTAEGLPICPRHSVPMAKREKQGDTWYSHKMVDPATGQIVYCRGYASASSPGYDVEPTARQPGKAVTGNGRQQHASQPSPGRDPDLDALNEALFG